MRCENKVAIVTGGAKGIGLAVVDRFLREGAKVVVADCDEGAARTAPAPGERTGASALYVKTDVSDSAQVQALVERALDVYRRIDILVNVAGIYARGDVVSTPEDLWNRVMQVNVNGVYLCSRAVIPAMRRQGGGVIINISSSIAVHATAPGIAAYTASKGAVTFLTRAMAADHLKENIRVNCVCPGPTDTPLLRASRSREELEVFVSALPSGRLLQPEEIAGAVLFLASDEASALTGVTMPVDIGQTAHLSR